jgi:hypothetical protein
VVVVPLAFSSRFPAPTTGGGVRWRRYALVAPPSPHTSLPTFSSLCLCVCARVCVCVSVCLSMCRCACVCMCVCLGGGRGDVCVCVCAIEPLHHHAHAACLQLLKYMCIFMYDMLTPAQQCCHSVCRIYLL